MDKNKKMIYGVFGLGVGVFIVVVLLLFVFNNITYSLKDAALFKDEYEKLNNVASEDGQKYPRVVISDNNKIKYTDYDEVIDLFKNKGDAVVYFGYPSCLYCRTAVQVLLDTSSNMDINEILYLDVKDKHDRYDELLNILGNEFVDPDDNKKIYSPLVIFIVDGNIVSYQKGTLFSQEDPYVELDKSQVDGLSEIYGYGIRDVINGLNDNNG